MVKKRPVSERRGTQTPLGERGYPDPGSAGAAAEDAEECLEVEVGAVVAVAVEVGGATGGAAVAAEAGEEGFDVGVGAGVTIVVEVRGGAAGAEDEGEGLAVPAVGARTLACGAGAEADGVRALAECAGEGVCGGDAAFAVAEDACLRIEGSQNLRKCSATPDTASASGYASKKSAIWLTILTRSSCCIVNRPSRTR